MQANDLGQERGESSSGVSDEVESLIEALAYAQTRARRAEGLVEDYDLRIQAAVLKVCYFLCSVYTDRVLTNDCRRSIGFRMPKMNSAVRKKRKQHLRGNWRGFGKDGLNCGKMKVTMKSDGDAKGKKKHWGASGKTVL